MQNIIVSDVFGKTSALITLAHEINASVIVDPYDGLNMNFKDEIQAYTYFTEHIGIDKYVAILLNRIKEYSGDCRLIGFSIGASVIWALSQLASTKNAKVARESICYYGSQIRNMSKLSPKFEVTLIFPQSESHFDVLALQQTLVNLEKVTTIHVDFLHGFMNTHSKNFHHLGYTEHLVFLREIST